MAHMDVFNDDAFNMVSMTGAVEKTPYVPQFLGSLGIFEPRPVPTVTVSVEKRDNVLALIQTSQRGAPLDEWTKDARDIRHFGTVRIAKGDTIQAHEIQGIRAFGTESELMGVQQEVARRNVRIRADVELTHENMRLGAIQGILLDADGTTLRNWFTEWNISQPSEIDFDLDTATTKVRGKCMDVIRTMQRAAKGAWTPATRVHALASDTFFDALIDHALVRDTYQNWAAAADLREDLSFRSFPYGGIMFHNYRGTDDNSTLAIEANKVKFFPVGAPGVFQVAYSPAETFDYVNTPGLPVYGMTIPDRDRNAWVRVEQYSYPLHICTRPEMLLRAKSQ